MRSSAGARDSGASRTSGHRRRAPRNRLRGSATRTPSCARSSARVASRVSAERGSYTARSRSNPARIIATFILIHGAWHGAWCWHKVTPLLAAAGARVLAPDLPSMGDDATPPNAITLDYWARYIADLAGREPEPVVLVAHSRGGIVASQAAELVPERVRRLVYVAAYLLPARATLAAEARRDTGSLIPPNMIPASSGITCTVRADVIREAFYGRCAEIDAQRAVERLSPEPLKPLVTPLELTPGRFGRVPRTYVRTTFDRVISPAAQQRMIDALPCDSVFTLDTDHSPFLSQPEALARILISI